MATADPRKVIRGLTGWLCHTPTNLLADFPHGGTAIGEVRDAELRWGIRTRLITAEEYGGQVVESIYTGESAVLACVLRGFDDDALSAIWPTSAAGSTGHRLLKQDVVTNEKRPGSFMSSRAVKLCFSPRAVDQHRFVVLFRAIPMVEETARLQLRLDEEVGLAVMFRGLPASDGRVYECGLRKDVTL